MRVIRFMSSSEAAALFEGYPIRNESKHDGFRTTSVGFCFFNAREFDTQYKAAKLLSGIADLSYCIVGTLDIKKQMKCGKGRYFDHETGRAFMVNEWSVVEYSLDDFTEYKFYSADFNASPVLYSGSWENPQLLHAGPEAGQTYRPEVGATK